MKSLNQFITEKRNKASVEIDHSPVWDKITPGVLETGEACIIIGWPCSRGKQEAWKDSYDIANKIGFPVKNINSNLEEAFKSVEKDLGEELDAAECLCIVYLPEISDLVVYTYQNGGVYAIK